MKTGRVGTGFRRELKRQLPLLEDEGVITAEQAGAISDRYRLDALASESTRALVMVIYTVGAFLIGIGVVSFVAAHWMAIPHQLKVCLLFAAMLGAHGLGFWLWKVSQRSAALGHALIILGTLIFGANIGLMAQIFHVEGRWNGLFLRGRGALSWHMRCRAHPMRVAVTSFVWFTSGIGWGREVCWYYPFAAAAFCRTVTGKIAFVWTCTLLAVMPAAVLPDVCRAVSLTAQRWLRWACCIPAQG